MVIFGGSSGGVLNSTVYVLDTEKMEWSQPPVAGKPPEAREMHTLTAVRPDRLLIFGGRNKHGCIMDDAVLLDTVEMRWEERRSTSRPTCAHTAVYTGSGEVLIFGGVSGGAVTSDLLTINTDTLEVQIVEDGSAGQDGSLEKPAPRFGHAAARIPFFVQCPSPRVSDAAGDGTPLTTEGKMEKRWMMVVFGGVNSSEDLGDVAIWDPKGMAVA
eukprot:SM000078S22017  [mRNA]  locus=s78:16930:18313:+ [translate_table: standard]